MTREDATNTYQPDRGSPPGETLLELLDDRRMSRAELAGRTGLPRATIDEIIEGQAGITADTA
ncbi:MAG TPA: helix-turn-helix domain-containing protein, partial [Thermoanaerobaculia bacterium]|nr:helix-turn-helix domain-containing protein [Thermoanaerobaculia bacterium]